MTHLQVPSPKGHELLDQGLSTIAYQAADSEDFNYFQKSFNNPGSRLAIDKMQQKNTHLNHMVNEITCKLENEPIIDDFADKLITLYQSYSILEVAEANAKQNAIIELNSETEKYKLEYNRIMQRINNLEKQIAEQSK